MENSEKLVLAGVGGVIIVIILLIPIFTCPMPVMNLNIDYPSLVFKPSEFQVGFSLKNTVPKTLVQNTITINSGKIIQIDNIPTDCEELTEEERICEESLSFKVNDQTPSGTNKIIFKIDSISRLNYPLLNNVPLLTNVIELSQSSNTIEIPINVETPEVERLISQTNLTHNKNNILLNAGISLLIGVLTFFILVVILFIPKIVNIIKPFI